MFPNCIDQYHNVSIGTTSSALPFPPPVTDRTGRLGDDAQSARVPAASSNDQSRFADQSIFPLKRLIKNDYFEDPTRT
jgi:hypothetical protein